MNEKWIYCQVRNWGKGFITHADSVHIKFENISTDLWRLDWPNKKANLWISKVGGIVKTRDEAQEIYDAEIALRQQEWDDYTIEGQSLEDKISTLGERPVGRTLEA